jgi:hypothetical protein
MQSAQVVTLKSGQQNASSVDSKSPMHSFELRTSSTLSRCSRVTAKPEVISSPIGVSTDKRACGKLRVNEYSASGRTILISDLMNHEMVAGGCNAPKLPSWPCLFATPSPTPWPHERSRPTNKESRFPNFGCGFDSHRPLHNSR